MWQKLFYFYSQLGKIQLVISITNELEMRMTTLKKAEEEKLLFSDFLEQFPLLGTTEWITVYSKEHYDLKQENIFSALILIEDANKFLQRAEWDLSIGGGMPGFHLSFNDDNEEIEQYCRFVSYPIEPLIYHRSFEGIKKDYFEVSEEFRHYFNLYEDKANNKFIAINDNGDEIEVVSIENSSIKIRLKYLKEFLFVKNMQLTIFFDYLHFSKYSLEEIGMQECNKNITKEKNFIYSHSIINDSPDSTRYKSFSRLCGKKLIHGGKKITISNSTDKKYVEFIIGTNPEGKEVHFTCEESKLADFFGKNPEAPNYCTPVAFKKDVLDKYYGYPEKYIVEDGYLHCGNLWGLRLDNNHSDYVVVLLGDLGQLTYKEQLHWKHHNITTNAKLSDVCWQRWFQCKPAKPQHLDLVFKEKFKHLNENWKNHFGWFLFQLLHEDDRQLWLGLHIPTKESQSDFDFQILSLVKIFIDSLNEKKLQENITVENYVDLGGRKEPKGLDKLEAFLKHNQIKCDEHIKFLRELQGLRSSAIAHRKGSNYDKHIKKFLVGESLIKNFEEILAQCIKILDFLEDTLTHMRDLP